MGKSDLFPCHSASTFRTFLIITGNSHLMGHLFTALGTDTVPSRSLCKTTTTTAAPAAFFHSTARSRACSITPWHYAHLFNEKAERASRSALYILIFSPIIQRDPCRQPTPPIFYSIVMFFFLLSFKIVITTNFQPPAQIIGEE